MIEYRGYIARVEYDDSVGLLHASVINSGAYPIANCEAVDVETLKRELRVSIDEYLASCEEDGVEPSEPAIPTPASDSTPMASDPHHPRPPALR